MAWTYHLNQSCYSFADYSYRIKELLKLCGWTILASGTGTSGSYSSNSDLLTTATPFATARAWYLAEHTATGVQMVWQQITTTSVRVKVSYSAGFSGGSPNANTVPSATDEVLRGGGSDASPTGQASVGTNGNPHIFHFVTDEELGSFMVAGFQTTGSTAFMPSSQIFYDHMEPGSYPEEDPAPFVLSIFGGNNETYRASTFLSSTNASNANVARGPDGTTVVMPMVRHGGGVPSTVVNPYSAKEIAYPILYERLAATTFNNAGPKGRSSLFFWLGRANALTGHIVSLRSTKDRMVLSDVLMPWDGVTEPIGTIAEHIVERVIDSVRGLQLTASAGGTTTFPEHGHGPESGGDLPASGWGMSKSISGAAYNAGAASVETIAGDGHVEFRGFGSAIFMVGLSAADTDATQATLDFGIQVDYSNNVVRAYENGVAKGSDAPFYATDVLAVRRTGTVITYEINGTTFYTSATSSSGNLLIDTSFYNNGGGNTVTAANIHFYDDGVEIAVTWQNATNVYITGGEAMVFDGTNDALISGNADTPTLAVVQGQWTVEAFVKPAAIGSNMPVVSIAGAVATESSATNHQFTLEIATTGRLRCRWEYTSGGTDVDLLCTTMTALSAGTWYHIAAVKNATHVRFYVDGTFVEQVAYSNNPDGGTNAIWGIGKMSATGAEFYSGAIKDIRFSAIARADGEIAASAALMNTTAEHPIDVYTWALWRLGQRRHLQAYNPLDDAYVRTINEGDYVVAGTWTRYAGDGSGIEVEIWDKVTGRRVGVVDTTTGGAFTCPVPNGDHLHFATAIQDGDHRGRSEDLVPEPA